MSKENKPRLDLMVDIETLGTDPNSVILQVAIVPFSPNPKNEVPDTREELGGDYFGYTDKSTFGFTSTISVFTNMLLGRTVSQDTINWWNDPKRADNLASMVQKIDGDGADDAREVLLEIYHIFAKLNEHFDMYLWCRGYDFDLPILDYAMRQAVEYAAKHTGDTPAYKTPWNYWAKRDVRSWVDMLKLVGIEPTKVETPHDAWADCMKQIKEVQEVISIYTDALNRGYYNTAAVEK